MSLGRSYSAACPACKSTSRIEGKERVPRCGRCGAVWPSENVEVLKGQVQTSRRAGSGLADRLADLATVGLHLSRLGRWERVVLLLSASTGLPPARLAEELVRRHPRARTAPTTAIGVGRTLAAARRDLEAALGRAGLLA